MHCLPKKIFVEYTSDVAVFWNFSRDPFNMHMITSIAFYSIYCSCIGITNEMWEGRLLAILDILLASSSERVKNFWLDVIFFISSVFLRPKNKLHEDKKFHRKSFCDKKCPL